MPGEGESFRLLQPGLMSEKELKDIISQRGVHMKGLGNRNKCELVEVYERLLQPLSQRKFPNTHLGKSINQKIAEEDRKQSRDKPKTSNFQYGFKDKLGNPTSSPKHPADSQSSSSSDRLKPPVDSSCLSSKKICLSRRSSSDVDLDKIIIKDRSKKSEDSKGEKRDSIDSSDDKKEKGKMLTLKTHSSSHKESKEDKDEPVQKRKKIAWP